MLQHDLHKKKAVQSATASAIIWGLGQFINGQKIKGTIYFAIQIFTLFNLSNIIDNLYGLITLGDKEMIIKGSKVTRGDNSIMMLLFGLIYLIITLILFAIYISNIRDAYRKSLKKQSGKQLPDGRNFIKHLGNEGFPYVVLIPSALILIAFSVIPNIFSFLIAFTNYSQPNHIPPKSLVDWVGLKNFANLAKMKLWSDTFLGVTAWTLSWAVLSTLTCFFGGLLVACLLNTKRVRCKVLWRTIFILPWAFPGMVSLLMFRNMFNGQFGIINSTLMKFHIISENIPWLSDATLAKLVCILVNFWLGFPYFMALMSGAITGISADVKEAAKIDGANGRQEFRKVTLPLVLFQTAPLLIMTFAGNLNAFGTIFFLTSGNPVNTNYKYAGSTDLLITWVYKLTRDNRQFAMASVMSILIFVVVASFSIANLLRTRSFREEDMMN